MRESFWYTLDENEQPVAMGDLPTRGFRALEVWPPLKTKVDGYEVSTVFLGLDHQHSDGPPILWETMIFGHGPVPWASGDDQEYQERYTSADDARAGHEQTVARLREKIAATTEPTTTAPRTGNDSLQVAETVTDPGAGVRTPAAAIVNALWKEHGIALGLAITATHTALCRLHDAGFVIVARDDLELAVEWMDQSDNPWSGEVAFQETGADAYVAHYALKDVLAESYRAARPDGAR